MNSYRIYMNYSSFYSSYIVLSDSAIAHYNNIIIDAVLEKYIHFTTLSYKQKFDYEQLYEFVSVSYEFYII